MVWRVCIARRFLLGGGLSLIGVGNISKSGGEGGVTRKGWEKIERGFDPQRNFDTSATAIYHTFANPILDFEDFGIVKNEISEHLVFFVS